MTSFVAAADEATRHLRALFAPTPLLRSPTLSERYGAEIWLKREDLSPVRSYKIRGAVTAMRRQRQRQPEQDRFVCASAGNHAQGMAFACRHFGTSGTIFMPVTTPRQKIERTAAFGGAHVEVRLIGDTVDQALDAAKAHCDAIGGHFLAPFDDPDVIEGQASVTAEILEALPDAPDMLVLPVGGGGLSAGARLYLKQAAPAVDLRLVEPAGGASLAAALARQGPVTLDSVDSFVDGAAVGRIGAHTYKALADIPPESVRSVPENRICITLLEMLNRDGIVLEPAGALAVDALADLAEEVAGKTVVAVTSGGNFDFERLPEVKERAMRYAGTKKYFVLRLPQRPGALRDFLELLGPDDDIARFEYLKKSARNFGSVLIGIETSSPDRFETLFDRLAAGGFAYRDITDDDTLAALIV